MDGGPNEEWMTYLRQLIAEKNIHFTFWCYNANSGDTGGLVLDDFTTWDEEKYGFVKEVLWQNEDGQFIGLDHEVPLGANGISLSDYSGKEVQPVAAPSETSAASTDAETTPDPYETEVLPSTGALEENAVSTTADRMFVVAIVLIGTAGLAAVIVIVFTIIKKRKMSENNK